MYWEEVSGSTDLKSIAIQDYFLLQMPVVDTGYHNSDQLLQGGVSAATSLDLVDLLACLTKFRNTCTSLL